MGKVVLPSGRGILTLRATDIPGKQSIELRSLVLTRQK